MGISVHGGLRTPMVTETERIDGFVTFYLNTSTLNVEPGELFNITVTPYYEFQCFRDTGPTYVGQLSTKPCTGQYLQAIFNA